MTRPRILAGLATATVAVLALLAPAVASAAARATLLSPAGGAVVSGPVELRVQVTRDVLDPAVRRVEVRVSSDGAGAAARTTDLTCVSDCDGTESVWAGRSYDPSAPFGGGHVCNGRWYLQVALDGGGFGAPAPVLASTHGSPAANVRVAIAGRDAQLSWSPAPQPDVSGYRIERRSADGDWTEVGTVGGHAAGFVDRDVDEGGHEWRVVTLRPDGRTGGGPAAPCADIEPDLATTSSVTRGRVTQPRPTETPTDDASEPTPGDQPTDATATEGGGSPAPVAGGDDGAETADAGAAPGRSGTGSRPAPAPAATEQPAPSERERYYGEDQGVGEIDYSGMPVAAEEAAGADPRGHWVPGGVTLSTGSERDLVALLRPVAGGLVLLTFGFHLRRWQREHDV